MTDVTESRSLLKRGAGQVRRASQTLAEAARALDRETVVHHETVVEGHTPADLAAKVAAASREHGEVDVLVIATTRAPDPGRRS